MITLQGVNKKYRGHKALEDINLNIKGVFGLLGPNGAGKTTLLEILATAVQKDSGEILYNNLSWEKPNEIRKKIGFVPQFFNMYGQITVQECMQYFASLRNVNKPKEKIEEVLRKVNLFEVKDRKIKLLSGGMLRRVGIAQALIGEPEILIVDEPTTGLDMTERIRFRKLLKLESNHKIVIISSHKAEDLEFLCDHFAILKQGHLVTSGTKQDIVSQVSSDVYEVVIPYQALNHVLETYNVMKFDDIQGGYKVRLLDKPDTDTTFIKVEPTLEESYLMLLNQLEGEE
jgi:ABC-2 type transport system ATP-binding protein